MSIVIAWIVWSFAAFFVLLWGINLGKKLVERESTSWASYFPILWGLAALVITACTDFSKFHLLWLIPMGLIFPLAILGMQFWSAFSQLGSGIKDAFQSMAEEMERQKEIYAHPLHFEEVDLAEMVLQDGTRPDREWYDRLRDEMTAVGFQPIADLESSLLSRIYPNMRTCLRSLVSEDGTFRAALTHIHAIAPDGSVFGDFHTYEFLAEFEDGTFLSYSNTEEVNNDESCEGIDLYKYPLETTWQTLLEAFRRDLSERTADGLTPKIIRTLEEMNASAERGHQLRAEAKHKEWEGEEAEDAEED